MSDVLIHCPRSEAPTLGPVLKRAWLPERHGFEREGSEVRLPFPAPRVATSVELGIALQ
jgi:hypothetical protein